MDPQENITPDEAARAPSIPKGLGRTALQLGYVYGLIERKGALRPSPAFMAGTNIAAVMEADGARHLGSTVMTRFETQHPRPADRQHALPLFLETFILEALRSKDGDVQCLVAAAGQIDEAQGLPQHSALGMAATRWWIDAKDARST